MSDGVLARRSLPTLEYAQLLWLRYAAASPRAKRRDLGQYCTPSNVAMLMAERVSSLNTADGVRALDPAAGTGVLAAALIEELVHVGAQAIEMDLYEIDPVLSGLLEEFARFAVSSCESRGIRLVINVRNVDFLLSNTVADEPDRFDVIISNPPYFKIRRADPRARPWLDVIDAQPNIYGLFMLATLSLLANGGVWCFLTPRSWMAGTYFSLLRRQVRASLRIRGFHFIEDRTGVFGGRGQVRQDVVVTWGVSEPLVDYPVEVSSGATCDMWARRTVPLNEILSDENDRILIVGRSNFSVPDAFNQRLADLGISVRTGAVVPFRCRWALKDECASSQEVPLLWLRHVRHQHVAWPSGARNEALTVDSRTEKYVVPDVGAVLVRRFGPSDAHKRVVAAPVVPGSFGSDFAVENHVNVLSRGQDGLSYSECVGLAAFLSSEWVDTYLKRFCGSTQINAADLRSLPVPSVEGLQMIAEGITSTRYRSVDELLAHLFSIERVT